MSAFIYKFFIVIIEGRKSRGHRLKRSRIQRGGAHIGSVHKSAHGSVHGSVHVHKQSTLVTTDPDTKYIRIKWSILLILFGPRTLELKLFQY